MNSLRASSVMVWCAIKKAPKRQKEYSYDLREVVIKHFLNRGSECEIARKILIPHSCINYVIKSIQINKMHWKHHRTRLKT